jgi:hypothetical protein
LLEERDQEKSSEMHRMEALMRSSIDLDNMIVLEAAILQKQFDDNFIDLSMILEAIRKIRSYAQENSRMVTAANNLLREMGEYLLED